MATTFTHNVDFESAAEQNFLAASLNSLANNALALSSAYTVPAGVSELMVKVDIASFGGNVAANGAIAIWALRTMDGGTLFEDGSASVAPARYPDLILPLRSGISTRQVVEGPIQVSPGQVKFLLQNLVTGQAMAASGNIMAVRALVFTSTAP